MVFDNLINAVTCWWFFKEVCSRVRSAWVESETRTCIQRLELNQSSPLFKVSFKLNTLLYHISLFSGCWNIDSHLVGQLNTCTFMTQQCLQFERRWCPWHRLILRSRKPGVNSLKNRLCEHLSCSVSQCANVSGQRVLHQLLCHGLTKHGVLLVQVVVSLAFHQHDPTWSDTLIYVDVLIYVDALQWSETTAWSTSLWPTGSWRRLCITSRLVIIFDLLSAWSSSWCNESKIGSFWFSKWWSPVHCCRSSGCANCDLCAQHWLRGFQVLC